MDLQLALTDEQQQLSHLAAFSSASSSQQNNKFTGHNTDIKNWKERTTIIKSNNK